MAGDRTDPDHQIPEADRLEHQAPVEPPSLIEAELVLMIPGSIANLVDEAERSDQETAVPGQDEDDHRATWPQSRSAPADALVEVAGWLYADFAEHAAQRSTMPTAPSAGVEVRR